MRAAVRLLLVPVLVALLMPGLVEAAENLWHVVEAGHSAHAVDAGRGHMPQDEEHGCSGTFHLCSCHPAPAWRPTAARRVTSGLAAAGQRGGDADGQRLDGYRTAPFHPPQA